MLGDNGTAPPFFFLSLIHRNGGGRRAAALARLRQFRTFAHLAADSDLIPNQSRRANYSSTDSSLEFLMVSAHVPALSCFLDPSWCKLPKIDEPALASSVLM